MKNQLELPENYKKIFELDLQKDTRTSLKVNLLAIAIFIGLAVPMAFVMPISDLFNMASGFSGYLLRLGALLGGLVAYILLHELVHGIFMRALSGIRPHYGFTGLYAYAGSTAYFNKKSYILIALAPVVICPVILGVACALVPPIWFWLVYIIQLTNLSGAAGDIYVTCKFAKMPDDILVRDAGVSMAVYSAKA